MFFYIPDLNQTRLEKPQTDHFFSMRVKSLDVLKASNLKGLVAKIKVLDINKKQKTLEYEILEQKQEKTPKPKILYQAILDKIYLEKLVEILPLARVNKLCLFASDYSQKNEIKISRLEKILIRSCQQSENPFLPKIELLDTLEVSNSLDPSKHIVLDKNLDFNFLDLKKELDPFSLTPLVGPEGGWSKAELLLFKEKKLKFVNLIGGVYPAWIAGAVYFFQQI